MYEEFVDKKYAVVRNAIPRELAEHIAIELRMIRDIQGREGSGDPQVPISWSFYSAIATESLLLQLQPLAEQVTGTSLYPCYSYSRIYYNGAEMHKHYDRPSCEFSASVSLAVEDEDDNWALWIDNEPIFLNPGDVVFYKGNELEHWRLPYHGEEHVQTFLHYVDANGDWAHKKYDGRQRLADPSVNKSEEDWF